MATVSPSFATRTLDDGSTYPVATAATGPTGQPYPTAESGAIVLHGYPIQPKVITEVTVDGYEARGAVIESMSSVPPVDGADIADPAYARAIVDLAANEPEVEPGSVIFPTAFQTVTHTSDGATSTDRLLLFPGQLTVDGPDATQLLFTDLTPTVYYVADEDDRAADRTRPQILESTAGATGDVIRFRVVARDKDADGSDGTGVARIVVLYNDRTNPQLGRRRSAAGRGDRRMGRRGAAHRQHRRSLHRAGRRWSRQRRSQLAQGHATTRPTGLRRTSPCWSTERSATRGGIRALTLRP